MLLVVALLLGVYSNRAGAVEWQTLLRVNPADTGTSTLTIDRGESNTIFAGTPTNGLFRSTDRGITWEVVWVPGTRGNYIITDIVVDPHHSGTVYVVEGNQTISKTEDGGGNWESLNISLGSVSIDPERVGVLYHFYTGLSKSIDGGRTWNMILGEVISDMIIDPQNAQTIYAVKNFSNVSAVFKSIDGGGAWSESIIANGAYRVLDIAISSHDSDVLYAGIHITQDDTLSGAYRSTNGGQTWVPIGLNGIDVTAIAVDTDDPNIIYAGSGAKLRPAGLFRSLDGGSSWEQISDHGVSEIVSDPYQGNQIYVGVWGSNRGGVYRVVFDEGSTIVEEVTWGRIKVLSR